MNDNKQELRGSETEREQPEAAAPEVTETPQVTSETVELMAAPATQPT